MIACFGYLLTQQIAPIMEPVVAGRRGRGYSGSKPEAAAENSSSRDGNGGSAEVVSEDATPAAATVETLRKPFQ